MDLKLESIISAGTKAGMKENDQDLVLERNVQVEPSKLIVQDNTRNHCQVQVARYQTQVARSSIQA